MAGELRRGWTMRGVVSGTADGTITTGGFTYDEATLNDLIREWLDLAFDYDRSLRDADPIVKVVGPGKDFASDGLARAATSYGRAYLTYLKDNREYCYNQAQLCQNALDDYLGVERRNVTEVERAGEPAGNPDSGKAI